jgi:hypothetical protein
LRSQQHRSSQYATRYRRNDAHADTDADAYGRVTGNSHRFGRPIAQNTDNPDASNQSSESDSLIINQTAKKVTTAALPFIHITHNVK